MNKLSLPTLIEYVSILNDPTIIEAKVDKYALVENAINLEDIKIKILLHNQKSSIDNFPSKLKDIFNPFTTHNQANSLFWENIP